jgi:hypothetical protein
MTNAGNPPPEDRIGQHDCGPEGRYRAVSSMAVASLVLGVLSVLTVWHWAFGLIPAAGILSGYFAIRRIRETPDELIGMSLALGGLILSVALGSIGFGVLWAIKAHEFPYGYDPISYEELQPDPAVTGQRIPPSAYELQFDPMLNNKVGFEGYMYPTRYPTGLKTFLLCPAIPNCPFCAPEPKVTEIVQVNLEGDLVAQYTTHPIRVGGKFRVDEMAPGGIIYTLDADFLAQPR